MTIEELTRLENESIHQFVQRAADDGFLNGRVLDYGCGRQPYRSIIEAAGSEYVGYDRASLPANMSGKDIGPTNPYFQDWDAVLVTQVIQFIPDYMEWLSKTAAAIDIRNGYLVMTGPTNWPIVNQTDLHRWTPNGIASDLWLKGFNVISTAEREAVTFDDFNFLLGWGVIAQPA